MTAETFAAGLVVCAAALTGWCVVDWVRERRERRAAMRRHPSGALLCACEAFALQYDKQHVLDQVDLMVHSRWNCAPFAEFIPPGR